MGKIIGVLFCGVFAALGIGFFIVGAIPMISGWVEAKSWQQVPADLISYKLKTNYGDDSETYKITASYSYQYLGQRHTSSKVSFSSGSDNIGSYHQDMNARLAAVERGSNFLRVWVNPKMPSEAVIDRDMRWGLLLFKSLFLFIFGGVGLGGLYLMYRFRNAGEVLPNADPDRPWTNFAEWNNATILSNAKTGTLTLLWFAIFWNVISFPMSFLIVEPLSEGNYLVLLVLLFPLAGVYLAWLWYKSYRSFKRVGLTPLTLDPYPASIGGQIGGVISVATYLSGLSDSAKITIRNIRSYETGSGKNRRTSEKILYEKTMVPSIEHTAQGMEIRFCFDLDDDLPVSEPPLELPRKTWQINFTATSGDGVEIDRNYNDVPVFATSKASSINDVQAYAITSRATLDAHKKLVESVLDLQPAERGYRLFFPAYQHKSMLVFVVAGLIFFGVGIAVPHIVFNIAFPFIGGLFTLVGVYAFANSLEVRIGAEGITSKRSLFGYQFKPKFVPSYSLKSFEKKVSSSSTSDKKTVTYYRIIAKGSEGEKAVVAKDLVGIQEADAAIEKLRSLFTQTL